MEDDTLLIQLLDKFPTGIMILSNYNNNDLKREDKQNNKLNEIIFTNSFIREIFQETFIINTEQEDNHNINYLII